MASSLSLLGLTVLVFAVIAIECRSVPDTDTLMPLMLDSMGNPLMILRDKRGSYQGYPSRTMMFTGFYRPPRRSGSNSQATSIYTEGNAIGGGAYFSQPVHLGDGPEPVDDVDDDDVASSVAEAHPDAEEEEHPTVALKPQDNEADEEQKRPAQKPSKGQKKGKTMPIDEDEDDEYDEEDDEESHRSSKPRGRKQYRPANNYFPMVFSFGPGSSGRRASSGAGSGGPVTAVANSYSTSKGGVASSVATAYGGAPIKKPRRRYSS